MAEDVAIVTLLRLPLAVPSVADEDARVTVLSLPLAVPPVAGLLAAVVATRQGLSTLKRTHVVNVYAAAAAAAMAAAVTQLLALFLTRHLIGLHLRQQIVQIAVNSFLYVIPVQPLSRAKKIRIRSRNSSCYYILWLSYYCYDYYS